MADEQLIKPRELPAASTVFADDAIMTDNGSVVGKATPVQIVNAGAPVPTEAEAIAGADNSKRMTPLTVKQVLDSVTAPSVLRAQAWAESDSPPNPGIPGSMSAKSWASEAERLGTEQADRAEAAAAEAALYEGPWLSNVAALIADTSLTYTVGQPGSVTVGDIVRTRAEGFSYKVSAVGAADHHVTTAGGVKLYVLPNSSGELNVLAFGAVGDGVADDAPAIQAAFDAAGGNPSLTVRIPRAATRYNIGSGLVLDKPRTNVVADDNALIVTTSDISAMITCTAGNGLLRGLHLARLGGSGRGLYMNGAPSWKLEHLRISGNTDGVATNNAHLTTLLKCDLYNNNIGLNDVGRSFGSELVGSNIIENSVGVVIRSNWSSFGGAIEQNVTSDALISVNADANGRYSGRLSCFGTHFEAQAGNSSATGPMVVVGPSGAPIPSLRAGFTAMGCTFSGNSSLRKAIDARQCRVLNVQANTFMGFGVGATLVTMDAQVRGARFSGNHWDGQGTFKSINAGTHDYIDMDADIPEERANNVSLKHNADGGIWRGVQRIFSAARSAALVLGSKRSSPGQAIVMQTPGADNSTMFNRMVFESGADVAKVTMDNATLSVLGSWNYPFRIGTAYYWTDTAGKFRTKLASAGSPASDDDGTVVGTQA